MAQSPTARPPLRRRGSYLAKDDAEKKTLKEFAKPVRKAASKKKGQAFSFQIGGGSEASNDGSKSGHKRAFGSVGQNKFNSSATSSLARANSAGSTNKKSKAAAKTTPTSAEPERPRGPGAGPKAKFSHLFSALKRQSST